MINTTLKTRVARALGSDDGMTTAEYAVGTVAACGFAGVLIKLLTSHDVISLLLKVIGNALGIGF